MKVLKYPNRFKLPSDREIRALFEEARALGINFIDTAPAYGTSEEKIGKFLPDRQDWIIGTKVGEEFNAGESHFDFSGAHTRESVERSLRRLKPTIWIWFSFTLMETIWTSWKTRLS